MDKSNGDVSKTTATLMIVVALLVDAIQALLDILVIGFVLNWLIDAAAGFGFYLWFKLHGVHFNSSKRIASFWGGLIIELIPIVNMLPGWTLAVVLVISTTKIEKVAEAVAGTVGVQSDAVNSTQKVISK